MTDKNKNEAGEEKVDLLDEALKNFKTGFDFLSRYCVEEAAPVVGEVTKKGLESMKEVLGEIGVHVDKATERVKEEFRKATESDEKDKK